MDTPEAPSLHPASARMRELLSLKALRAEAPLFAGEARSGE